MSLFDNPEQQPDSPDAPVPTPGEETPISDPSQSQFDEEDDNLVPLEDEDELESWKSQLRNEFEAWLDDLEEIPEPEPGEETPDTPDLYSFYSQWAAANAEARKGNRRTAEAFSQWGDTLGRFDGDLKLLREQMQRLSLSAAPEGMSRTHCLALVELLDRVRRVACAFKETPSTSWWGGTDSWRRAWESHRQAFDILVGHFESLLKKEGLSRIETAGQPFDPSIMSAVAAEPDASRPDQSILDELAPGYRLRGELLRPAQVKVSLNKS